MVASEGGDVIERTMEKQRSGSFKSQVTERLHNTSSNVDLNRTH